MLANGKGASRAEKARGRLRVKKKGIDLHAAGKAREKKGEKANQNDWGPLGGEKVSNVKTGQKKKIKDPENETVLNRGGGEHRGYEAVGGGYVQLARKRGPKDTSWKKEGSPIKLEEKIKEWG